MFTSLTADEVIIDSFTAGAINYINKLNYKELPDSIRAVLHNQSSIHSSAALALRNEIQRLKREEISRLISPTEKEILKLIDKGYTQSQIAKQMISAERTIKNHINRILRKLGVESSKQALPVSINSLECFPFGASINKLGIIFILNRKLRAPPYPITAPRNTSRDIGQHLDTGP